MITIVMAYYENGGMLDRHIGEWKNYPDELKDQFKAVIVDDGSSKDPALPHVQDVGFPIELYRINVDIPWNQNGARNLAMTHADGWCLMTDMDHLLLKGQAERLCNMQLRTGYYYRPLRVRAVDKEQYKRHPNSYVLHRDLYWQAGGYDEAFCGWYGTDSTFRRQLAKAGKLVDTKEFYLLLYGREVIPDASTTNYGRKDTKYHVSNSPELRQRRGAGSKPIPPLNFPWERQL